MADGQTSQRLMFPARVPPRGPAGLERRAEALYAASELILGEDKERRAELADEVQRVALLGVQPAIVSGQAIVDAPAGYATLDILPQGAKRPLRDIHQG